MGSPSVEQLERAERIPREEAFALAGKLEDAGVRIDLIHDRLGWKLRPQRHTDLIVLAGILQAEGFGALYGPFGRDDGAITVYKLAVNP